MTANVSQFIPSKLQYFFYARKNGSYPYGATGTIAAGSDASMVRHKGLSALSLAFAQSTRKPILGDGGKLGEFLESPLEAGEATVTFTVLDQVYEAAISNQLAYADGEFDAMLHSQKCKTPQDMCAIISGRAKSNEAGSVGQDKWFVLELWDYQDDSDLFNSMSGSDASAVPNTHTLSLDETTVELSGLAVNSTNYGISQADSKWYWSEYPVAYHTHIGNGADTTLTLDFTPAANSGAKVQLWQDGVLKTYTTHYSVSGTAFTFAVAPASNVVSIIRYQFVPDC